MYPCLIDRSPHFKFVSFAAEDRLISDGHKQLKRDTSPAHYIPAISLEAALNVIRTGWRRRRASQGRERVIAQAIRLREAHGNWRRHDESLIKRDRHGTRLGRSGKRMGSAAAELTCTSCYHKPVQWNKSPVPYVKAARGWNGLTGWSIMEPSLRSTDKKNSGHDR